MITRLELDGFKTFQDFKLELAPFQVIVGPNGAGKSNLFDALGLLSRLADTDLRSAFQDLRGEAGELFTILRNGRPTNRMRLAVEMLVDHLVQDSWGAQAELNYTRLRYELEIERRKDEHGLERLYVARESLVPLLRNDDTWMKRFINEAIDAWLPPLKNGRGTPFIATEMESGTATIFLYQDGSGGQKASAAERVERTILSGVTSTEFPHALAAREEMRSWGLLQLNPAVLRQPSSMLARPIVSLDGSNLPTALARMEAEDPLILNDVSRDLANLVPGILQVEMEKDQSRNQYVIWAKTQDGRCFSSRVLSDGTLRMLALVIIKNNPEHRGVLCLEEPENGVHPSRFKNLIQLLRELATDFSDSTQANEPLRQLLVNTHSPLFVSQTEVLPELLFAHTATRVQPSRAGQPLQVTKIVPLRPHPQIKLDESNHEEAYYTLHQIIDYLHTVDVGEAIAILEGDNGQ